MANAIETIKALLSDNWIAANTDNRSPNVDLITNYKRYDLRVGDIVMLYKPSGTAKAYGMDGVEYTDRVSIDCRSVWRSGSVTWQAHGQKIEDEVLRILEGKRVNPASGWHYLIPLQPLDLDDKGRRLAKRVIDCHLMRLQEVTAL